MRRSWIAVPLLVLAACNSDSTGPGGGRAVDAPNALTSTSLDGAVALTWSDNAFIADPDIFDLYTVYSTSYDLDADLCGTNWDIEGTTVAPEFVVGDLTNGVPRCFAVTAVSIDAVESARSPLRNDTPRPDARNVAIFARQASTPGSGFRFWQDVNGDGSVQDAELGLVKAGTAPEADFTIERDAATQALFITPNRPEVEIALYGNAPIEDLTSIDLAPNIGYAAGGLEALPGWGYVFEIAGGDGFFRYGAVRVTHVGRDLLILDWAYQTDPGNPELVVGRRR
jgi:hypothetical protein